MFQVDLQVYVYALSMLMILSISTIVVVIYNLKKVDIAATSLRIYGVYFFVGLIGWIGLVIKDATQIQLDLTLPVMFYMLCSFILWLALKECTECNLFIFIFGMLHAIAIIANIFMDSDLDRMFLLTFYAMIIYPFLYFLAYSSARRNKNIGLGIIAFAVLVVIFAVPLQFYGVFVSQDPDFVYGVVLAASSSGFTLVGIGFLTSVIIAEHQQLTRQALNDPLTGLLNRRGLDYSLNVSLNSAQRLGKCVSAIALDIDYFKKINDTHGHDAGDFVLQELSKTLQDNARAWMPAVAWAVKSLLSF